MHYLENHYVGTPQDGLWLSDKEVAQGGQGPACETEEGRRDGLQNSDFQRWEEPRESARRSNQETTKGQPVDMSPWCSKGHMKCHVLKLLPGTKERKGLGWVLLCTCRSWIGTGGDI